MKIILMLIVGLMLAGCESTENHVRNRDAVDRNRYLARFTGRARIVLGYRTTANTPASH